MTAIKLTVLSIFCTTLFFSSCKKDITLKSDTQEEFPTRRPTPPPPPPPPVNTECNYDIAQSVIESSGWTMFFGDEFETNFDKWDAWNSGAYNNELQLYQSSNATLEGGNLVIRANKETPAVTGKTNPFDQTDKSFEYTSARLESKKLFSASASSAQVRIMARIKLPSGYGMWPAFWSYGDPWPTQGEIDILEARGQEDFKYQTNYFYGRAANRNLVRNAEGYITTEKSLQSCYHVYELIWSQNELKFYFDGVLVHTNSGGYVPNLFGKQEKITLNLAVGGDFFSNFNPSLIQTGTMYVDWVKVFTKSN